MQAFKGMGATSMVLRIVLPLLGRRPENIVSIERAVRLSLIVGILAATGCAPGYKPTLQVPKIQVKLPQQSAPDSTQNSFVYIDQFEDRRPTPELATLDGKPMLPDGPVIPEVVAALKAALEAKGFAISESAPVILSGELRVWHANVTGSFPTNVAAEAVVNVEILDPSNRRIYSGVYKGFSSAESSSIDHLDIQQTLASSLEEALRQIATDKQLQALLSSY